jgi:hypothetical protein
MGRKNCSLGRRRPWRELMLSIRTWTFSGCFTQERGLKPEYTKKFLNHAAKTEASPSVMVTGQPCVCAWHIWYLRSVSKCRPWVHLEFLVHENSVLFYSEDNKPKALTNGDG